MLKRRLLYAAAVAFATIVLDELPKAFKARTKQSDRTPDIADYQPGKWANESTSTDYAD